MNKQSDFIEEFIRKFISKDIPSKLIYKNNYVAENCNKREDYMFEDVIVCDPQTTFCMSSMFRKVSIIAARSMEIR